MNSSTTAFSVRGINVCESLSRHTPAQIERLLNRLTQWNMNTLVVHPQYGYRRHQQTITRYCKEHGIALVQYLYTTLAFAHDADRSLFAVDDHGKPHRERIECETRLCPSNAAAMKLFAEGAKRYLEESVEAGDHLLLATPDGELLCRCARCRKMNAVEQWQPMLEIAVDQILRSGKPLKTHFIAYIGRFTPPQDMAVFKHIDAVMFDTHLRYRWAPIGADHAMGQIEQMESVHDPRAGTQPINRYLLDRLKEWRERFSGSLYVFENLMIQSCFSMPQPNTPALLDDLETYRRLGINGVVYEAFEPGMLSFADQLNELSQSLDGKNVSHKITALEQLTTVMDQSNIRSRAVPYLLMPDARKMFGALAQHMPDAAMLELARRLRVFFEAITFAHWRQVTQWAMQHPERFDWIYIAYRLATYLPAQQRPENLSEPERKLFATTKPWDYFEDYQDDPPAAARAVIQTLLARSCDAEYTK